MKDITQRKIGLYAPGEYKCHCTICKEVYSGDKRSTNCINCAIDQLEGTIKKYRSLFDRNTETSLNEYLKIFGIAYIYKTPWDEGAVLDPTRLIKYTQSVAAIKKE